jgi:hypothetical protein
MAAVRSLAGVLAGWHVRSQQQARRNALVASTALTRQRIERDEVEAFLAWHVRRWHRLNGVKDDRLDTLGVI